MNPSSTDEDLLADLLLAWEESGRQEPVHEAAQRLTQHCPHLIEELERRIDLLSEMAWLDDPVLYAPPESDDQAVHQEMMAGRYRLLKRLSSGWCGSLYHAMDLELGRNVAIKAPRTKDAVTAENLLHEGRCASQLRHPGIVPVFDAGRDGGVIFLVYEYITGMNLSQRIAQGPIPWREALEITRQIIEATAHAHAAGVLHRDIKPANILLENTGKALLADFGSAVSISQLPFSDSLGTGSLAFTAPEVLRGQEASPGSDLYSIGMVLHSMLHGTLPSANLAGSALRQVVLSHSAWEFRSSLGVPRAAVYLCQGMIAKDPDRRLTDANAILNLIRKAKTPNRHPMTYVTAGLLIPALVGGWWCYSPQISKVSTETSFEFEHEPSADGTIGGSVLKLPVGLAFAPDGTLVVANAARGQMCRFRRDGGLLQIFGKRGSGPRFLFYPHGVAISANGTVLVTDHGNHVVHAYNQNGDLVSSAGGYGSAPGRFIQPHGIAISKDGRIYVGDSGNRRVQVLDANLQWLMSVDLAQFGVKSIVGLLVQPDGHLLVSDYDSGKVWIISSEGTLMGTLSVDPSFRPLWLAMDPAGNTWVGDASKRVIVFGGDLKQKTIPSLDTKLTFYPQGFDFGPKGELAIVNYNTHRVVMLNEINGKPTGFQ